MTRAENEKIIETLHSLVEGYSIHDAHQPQEVGKVSSILYHIVIAKMECEKKSNATIFLGSEKQGGDGETERKRLSQVLGGQERLGAQIAPAPWLPHEFAF